MNTMERIKELEALEAEYKDGRELLTWEDFNKAYDLLEGTDVDFWEVINNCDFDCKEGFIDTQDMCGDFATEEEREKLKDRIEEAQALKCDFVGLDLYNSVKPVYTWLYSVAIGNAIFDLKNNN